MSFHGLIIQLIVFFYHHGRMQRERENVVEESTMNENEQLSVLLNSQYYTFQFFRSLGLFVCWWEHLK